MVTTASESENGLLPDNIEEELQEFEKLIKWKRVAGMSNAEIPEPQPGIDEVFDSANEFVVQIKGELDDYLKSVQTNFKDKRICFSHAKNRYEIEIPEHHVKGNKKPREFELVSTRQGFERFYTPVLRRLVEQLEIAEDKLKDALSPFLTAIFSNFH